VIVRREPEGIGAISNVHVPPNWVSSTIFVTSFDGGNAPGPGFLTYSNTPTSTERAIDLAVEPNGDLVVSGDVKDTLDSMGLSRYAPVDGAIDTGFGDQGWVVAPLGTGTSRARGVATQSNGRILATGEYFLSDGPPVKYRPFLARFHDDAKAPQTKITGQPPRRSHDPTPTFKFAADMPASFRCSLDGKAFKNCNSPKNYAPLDFGGHIFRVKGVDSLDKADPTPARAAFRILK